MRAAVLRELGAQLSIEQVELDPPGHSMVQVDIVASGVCHTDVSIQSGGMPQMLPAILGHEGAGIVSALGAGVTELEVGDHVVLTWSAPCRTCFYCLAGQSELCVHCLDHAWSGPVGSVDDEGVHSAMGLGTFAERTVVPASAAIKVDDDLDLVTAALIGCAVTTGVGAVVNTAGVEAFETVAVIGCGGVGLAVVQGARLAGASIICAVDVSATKLQMALDNGATHTIRADETDAVDASRELTGGIGPDHVFEVVGLSETMLQAYRMTRRGGSVTIVGAGRLDDPVTFSAMSLMADAKTLRGSVYGSTDAARDVPRIVAMVKAGRLDLDRLVSRRIGLDEVNDAIRAMLEGEVARSVIVFDGPEAP